MLIGFYFYSFVIDPLCCGLFLCHGFRGKGEGSDWGEGEGLGVGVVV